MSLLIQKIKITLKNTIPTYIMISIFTLFFLGKGNVLLSFSKFGENLSAKIIFALIFNLLYFIPQSLSIFTGLHLLKNNKSKTINHKKSKWFLRIPPPLSVIITVGMILGLYYSEFFANDLNPSNLYITFIIIIMMNILFSAIMTINIYTIMNNKLELIRIKKAYTKSN